MRQIEFWNEPADPSFWAGTAEQYAAAASATRDAIERVWKLIS